LIASSAPAFRALLKAVLRLTNQTGPLPHSTLDLNDETLAQLADSTLGLPKSTVRDVLGADRGRPVDAQALIPAYITLTERLWTLVDTWHG
jgi:hypothetical protein